MVEHDDEVDMAYMAGLFDGEGSIHFKRGIEKKKGHKGKPGYRYSNSMRISMEITMTDRILCWFGSMKYWVLELLDEKRCKSKRKDGSYLKQYKWRCTFRDAYYVSCLLIWPFAHVKLDKIQQIIESLFR